MSVTEFRYKAFISYSHADKAWAEWLLKSLESYRVPKNLVGRKTDRGMIPTRLAPIFRDRDELPAAHRLTERLFEALKASEFLIVLCSPRAAQSKLVNREIVEFKKTHGDGHVLCMIIEGTPFSDDPTFECFPEALLHSFTPDGKAAGLSAEGLAADARPNGDGRKMALMKIIAGLLGLGLNDIVRREEQRRHRNLLAIAMVSVALTAVMGALTYEASVARKTAFAAEKLAEQKRQDAEKQLAQNEYLTQFLMGAMYDKLLALGSLDTLEAVCNKILESYREHGLQAPSEKQLFTFIDANLKLADTFDNQGEAERATKLFHDTMELARDFHAFAPTSPAARYQLSRALSYTCYRSMYVLGDFDAAERHCKERLNIVTIALKGYQKGAELEVFGMDAMAWQKEYADATDNLGRVLTRQGKQSAETIRLAQESVKTREIVAATRPGDALSKMDLASSRQNLAYNLFKAGNLYASRDAYREALEDYDGLEEQDPNNFHIKWRKSIISTNAGKAEANLGNFADALSLIQNGRSGFDQLVSHDPENTMWLVQSARVHYWLALTLMKSGRHDQAGNIIDKMLEQSEAAMKRDSNSILHRLTYHNALLLRARRVLHDQGAEAAFEKIEELFALLDQEEESYRRTDRVLSLYASANLLKGELHAFRLEHYKARQHWEAAVNAFASAERKNLKPDDKELLASAHFLLGNSQEASRLRRQLLVIGYHPAIPLTADAHGGNR